MTSSNDDIIKAILQYQERLERYKISKSEDKIQYVLGKLGKLPIRTSHLETTGVGRTVNALKKFGGEVGEIAKNLVLSWKEMVLEEEKAAQETSMETEEDADSNYSSENERKDCEQDLSKETVSSRSDGNESEEYENKQEVPYKSDTETISSNERHRKNGGRQSSSESSESEEEKSSKYDKHSSSKRRQSSESNSSDRHSTKKSNKSDTRRRRDSSESDSGDRHRSKKSSKETKKRKHSSDSSSDDRHSSKKNKRDTSPKSSHKHKSSKDDHRKSSKDEYKSSKDEKEKSERKDKQSSSKHRETSEKHKSSSEKHKDSSEKSDPKHKSKRDEDTRNKSKKDSDEEKKHKSKKEYDGDHKSSKAEKHKNHEERESSHSNHKSEKSKKHEEKSEKHDKNSQSSHSSKHRDKESSHSSSDKKSSKEKDKREKDKDKHESKTERKEEKKSKEVVEQKKSEHKPKESSSKHDSSEKKNKTKKDKDVVKKVAKQKIINGIDSESGASFAEALGMCGPYASSPKKKAVVEKKKESSTVEKYVDSDEYEPTSKPKSKSKYDDGATASSSSSKVVVPGLLKEPEPLNISLSSLLPEISPNYKPLGISFDSQPKRIISDDEALSRVMMNKNQRTKVYSGNKSIGKVESLFQICVRVLQDNIDALEYTGGVPYIILKPIMERATPDQLFNLEHHNPYLIEDTDELWKLHCQKDFRTKRREEMESWRDMYMRCLDEREAKLNAVTATIKLSQDKSIPVRTTKLAYVDAEYVKPPRNIAKKQAKNGTINTDRKVLPSQKVTVLAKSGEAEKIAVPDPGKRAADRSGSSGSVSASAMKPKKAPLMAKTLSFLKNRFKR